MYFVFELSKVFVFVFKYYSEYLTPNLVWRLHDCTCMRRLHDCTCVSGGYMTVHVSGGYMTVHVCVDCTCMRRLHDCTCVCVEAT